MFWFLLEDIKIPDIPYKIQKFLRTSWASIIMNKDLLHLIYLNVDNPFPFKLMVGKVLCFDLEIGLADIPNIDLDLLHFLI